MRTVMFPENYDSQLHMNAPQYEQTYHPTGFAAMGEHETNMTKKGGTMDGVPKPADHYMAQVEHKIIESTKKTERTDKVAPSSKAYNLLAKSGYKGMPNNHGSSVIKGIYKPGAER